MSGKKTQVVTRVPGSIEDSNAMASSQAPVIFAEEAPCFAVMQGVVAVTLEAQRLHAVDGKVATDRITVAHLKLTLHAATNLRDSLNKALAMSERASAVMN